MSLSFYQLKEPPFGSMPDTRFLFVNPSHRRALGSILVALQQGNRAVSLVGQTGLGKTTLLFHMFRTLAENVTTVYLFQPPRTPVELLRAILADLGVREMDEIPQEMLRLLRGLLADHVRQQKRVVVVIDQAQNLEPSVMEVLWSLSNPEGPHGHLLQFVLSGQSDMVETVGEPGGAQLAHRTPIVARLEPLGQEDTALYIDHRLRVAGYTREAPLFTAEANALIASYSDGVPRKINSLCFSSMSLAYKTKQRTIEADTVRAVIADLGLDRLRQRVIGPAPVPALPQAPPRVLAPPVVAPPPVVASPSAVREEARKRIQPRVPAAETPLRETPPASVPAAPEVVPIRAAATATKAVSPLIPKLGLVAAVVLALTVSLVTVRRHAAVKVQGTPRTIVRTPAAPPAQVLPQVVKVPVAPPAVKVAVPVAQPAVKVAAPVAPPVGERNLKGMDLKAAVRALHRRSLDSLCKADFSLCDNEQLQDTRKVKLRPAHSRVVPGPGRGDAAEAATDRAEQAPLATSN